MKNNKPLLSICIPTYNRAEVLKENLTNIVSLSEFDDEVEIVISDNASTDNTEEIARDFALKYHNIKYYRNMNNVRDYNFELTMNRATGFYIKLQNDWLQLTDDGLKYVKSKIKEHIIDKTPLFFTDNNIYTKKKSDIIVCNSLDEYIQSISTFVTFIGIFGAWKEQWENIRDKNKYVKLLLCQNDWSYQLVNNRKGCIIYNKKVANVIPVPLGVRSGYNWFKIHLDNYYQIMMPYIDLGLIEKETIRKDKKYLLKHFIPELLNTYVLLNKNPYFKYDTKGTFFYFWKYYKKEYYFYILIILFPIWWIYYNFLIKIKKVLFLKK